MRILITGGTGTFGRSFLRLLEEKGEPAPCVVARNEALNTYTTLSRRVAGIYPIDITNPDIKTLVHELKPDLIVHAAAMKRIDSCASNFAAAMNINVRGTSLVANAASELDIPILMISSDKAVHPVNLYGKTKMLGEAITQNYSKGSVLRYGNVIGSRGSCVDLWSRLPVERHTCPPFDTTRYWISSMEAADRAWQAIEIMMDSSQNSWPKLFISEMGSAPVVDVYKTLHAPNIPEMHTLSRDEKEHEKMATALEFFGATTMVTLPNSHSATYNKHQWYLTSQNAYRLSSKAILQKIKETQEWQS